VSWARANATSTGPAKPLAGAVGLRVTAPGDMMPGAAARAVRLLVRMEGRRAGAVGGAPAAAARSGGGAVSAASGSIPSERRSRTSR